MPAAVRAVNAVLELVDGTVAATLTPDRLLDSARRHTGLSDFGEGDVRTPLERLLDSVHGEARLHPLGYLIIRQRILGVLENRLRSEFWWGQHPEILQQELDPPIVITGLQRTGTTLLQRLLAADPDARSLASWEGLNPAPRLRRSLRRGPRRTKRLGIPEGQRSVDGDPRIHTALRAQRALRILAPEFFIIHPVEYDGPEEEVLLLDSSLISTVPEALMHVPSFSQWVEQQDQSPAYRRLAMLLKLLQWQERRSHWVLKSPHHLEWPEFLTAHLPGTRMVMLHRDPVVATSSFYSMVWHSNRLLSHDTSAELLARHWFRKTQRMIGKILAFRDGALDSVGANDVIDISYYDLTRDPMHQVERIYEHFGMSLTGEARARMQEVLRRHRRDKYGIHRYHPESFGISRAESEAAFAEYRERFEIPREECK